METDPKLLEILICPVTRTTLRYDRERQELISRAADTSLSHPRRRADHAAGRGAQNCPKTSASDELAQRIAETNPGKNRLTIWFKRWRALRPGGGVSQGGKPLRRSPRPWRSEQAAAGDRQAGDVRITRLEPVGVCCVRIVFDDGHDSGLYSWEYLAELGKRGMKKDGSTPAPRRRQSLARAPLRKERSHRQRPGFRSRFFDFYHRVLTASWTMFQWSSWPDIFVIVNIAFAVLYMLDRGGISHAEPGNFWDAFFSACRCWVQTRRRRSAAKLLRQYAGHGGKLRRHLSPSRCSPASCSRVSPGPGRG